MCGSDYFVFSLAHMCDSDKSCYGIVRNVNTTYVLNKKMIIILGIVFMKNCLKYKDNISNNIKFKIINTRI